MVEQALTPGMSVAGLAMHNQVNANLLRRWVLLRSRRDAGAVQERSSRLVPVVVAPEPDGPAATLQALPPTAEVAVEIELNGAVVRVREGATAQTLRQVIAALRGSGS